MPLCDFDALLLALLGLATGYLGASLILLDILT